MTAVAGMLRGPGQGPGTGDCPFPPADGKPGLFVARRPEGRQVALEVRDAPARVGHLVPGLEEEDLDLVAGHPPPHRRLEAQRDHREVAIADTYTLMTRATVPFRPLS